MIGRLPGALRQAAVCCAVWPVTWRPRQSSAEVGASWGWGVVAGMKEEKAMSHVWVDTGTERKTEQACAGWSPRRHEAGSWSWDLGDLKV